MRYLLDTHTFLWWDTRSSRLSRRVFDLISDRSNGVWLSMASVWEVQIKHQLARLELSAPLEEIIRIQQRENGINLLPIDLSHVLGLSDLPHHHKDPFDRLLVAQAMAENLVVLSHDPQIARYPVPVVW
ncbi:MAG: type II toxin-antitoxin system VapC family toxin [Chloroflexota bacterium]|jgi:PIN domain nuclease of toxin-antitoxin system